MTFWASIRRAVQIAIVAVVLIVSSQAEGSEPGKDLPQPPSVEELRKAARAAEKNGDWEAAFAAYCHLYVADRGARDIREKLSLALRRTQQLRRHRDPHFQQFAASMTVSDAMKLYGEVLTKVSVMYVDRERATPQILWEHGIDELARALTDPAFRTACLNGASSDAVDGFRTALRLSWAKRPVRNAADAKLLLRKLIAAAQEKDSFTATAPSALILEILCGSCGELDEYTVFLNPSQLNPDSISAIPDLSAQGVYLEFAEDEVLIGGIAPYSWAAYNTTLAKGDRIVQINGRPLTMGVPTPAVVAESLRAHLGEFHSLLVARAGSSNQPSSMPDEFQLPVVVPTVYGERMVTTRDGVGYARVGNFTASTPRELDDVLNRMKLRGIRAIVLDLRGNMGGSFLAGVETAKRLIPAGIIVSTQGQLPQIDNQPFSSDSGMSAHDLPVVVLVDSETASAAEVLAAALKDHNRATLIGMPTFGKGTIQYPLRLDSLDDVESGGKSRTNKSGGVRLTIAKFVSPRGTPINGVGIVPHILEADRENQLKRGIAKAAELIPISPTNSVGPMLPIAP